MLQGPGIVDIEDMDQDMYEAWQKLDLMGGSLLDKNPRTPVNAIMFYTLTLPKWRGRERSFKIEEGDKNAV